MDIMAAIPGGVISVAVTVLVYSFLNLLAAVVVAWMYWRHGERFGIVSIAAWFILIQITTSMVQQINYVSDWRSIKLAAFEAATDRTNNDDLKIVRAFTRTDRILSLTQYYCYNVESLLFMFWVAALVQMVYQLRMRCLGGRDQAIAIAAKLSAILIPIIPLVIQETELALENSALSLYLENAISMYTTINSCTEHCANQLVAGATIIGNLLLLIVLSKCIHIRRRVLSRENSSSIPKLLFTVAFGHGRTLSKSTVEGNSLQSPETVYNKWLIFRFFICFLILRSVPMTIFYSAIFTEASTAPFRRSCRRWLSKRCSCCAKKRQAPEDREDHDRNGLEDVENQARTLKGRRPISGRTVASLKEKPQYTATAQANEGSSKCPDPELWPIRTSNAPSSAYEEPEPRISHPNHHESG